MISFGHAGSEPGYSANVQYYPCTGAVWVLMVNGEDDFDLPLRTAQVPLFNALGTAEADKRHVTLKGGHMPPEPQLVFKEILGWLDKYLGPLQ